MIATTASRLHKPTHRSLLPRPAFRILTRRLPCSGPKSTRARLRLSRRRRRSCSPNNNRIATRSSLNEAQRSSAEASLAQAVAQRDQAQLNLSYTIVTAAQTGRVVNLTASPGEFAPAGTNLTMFVPDEIWVTANFKETQLASMRPGQPAAMHIDAYP